MSASLLSGAPVLSSDEPAKRKRRRRGNGKGPSGPVIHCEQVSSARLISLFLRSLSAKEKGYALQLLLDLAKQAQKPATPEGGLPW